MLIFGFKLNTVLYLPASVIYGRKLISASTHTLGLYIYTPSKLQ